MCGSKIDPGRAVTLNDGPDASEGRTHLEPSQRKSFAPRASPDGKGPAPTKGRFLHRGL
jgi:hypothetical protein